MLKENSPYLNYLNKEYLKLSNKDRIITEIPTLSIGEGKAMDIARGLSYVMVPQSSSDPGVLYIFH